MSGPGRKKTISDGQFLLECRKVPDPVFTAKEVAERVDMTPQGVNERFDELVAEGYLKEKQVGARAIVYWLTDRGKELAANAG